MNSAIHYSDFVILGGNCISENMHVDFIDCFKLLLDTNFEILKNDLCESFGLKKYPKEAKNKLLKEFCRQVQRKKTRKSKIRIIIYAMYVVCIIRL